MSTPEVEGSDRVLTAPAVAFVEDLTRRFRGRVDELLAERRATQDRFNSGSRPDFLSATSAVRADTWRVAPPPADFQDRRVEITGPVGEELARVREELGAARFDGGRFPEARALFEQVATSEELVEFLTIPAYEILVNTS